MIGNTVEFVHKNELKKGVVVDKFTDAVNESEKDYRDIYTYCLVDYYLIRLTNGDLIPVRPRLVKKIVSFFSTEP